MSTILVDDASVTIPPDVNDLRSFRRWLRSDRFPEAGRVSYYRDQVWVDMSDEQIFTHNQVKNEIAFVLTGLAKRKKLGRYFPDGVFDSNPEAGLSCQPDGTFVRRDTLDAGRVRLVEGVADGFVELEGSPDLVVEVVSRSSVEKDTSDLLELYWHAGVEEYWLIDVRDLKPHFTIYQAKTKGFVAVRRQQGWQKSRVFDESFRLVVSKDDRGDPDFNLEVA